MMMKKKMKMKFGDESYNSQVMTCDGSSVAMFCERVGGNFNFLDWIIMSTLQCSSLAEAVWNYCFMKYSWFWNGSLRMGKCRLQSSFPHLI